MTVSRRVFLETLAGTAAPLLLGARSVPHRRVSLVLRVGLVASEHEEFASAARGAGLGAVEARRVASMLGGDVTLHQSDDPLRLMTSDRVHVLLGGFDGPSCAALADLAERHDRLFLNVGCTADSLRGDRCRRHMFHVAASDAMRRDALAQLDRGYHDVGRIVLWDAALVRYGAAQLNDRYRAEYRMPMEPAAWSAWMAVKIASEAVVRLRAIETARFVGWLTDARTRFDGHKGRALSFRPWDHQLRQPLYWRRPAPDTEIVELPPTARGTGVAVADQLDRLGTSAEESACQWERG